MSPISRRPVEAGTEHASLLSLVWVTLACARRRRPKMGLAGDVLGVAKHQHRAMVLTLAAVTAGLGITVVVSTIAFVAVVVLALRAVDAESGHDGSEGTDPGSEGRGGGNDRPRPRPGRGGGPAWWPEFERELDRYVAQQGRDRHETGARARSHA